MTDLTKLENLIHDRMVDLDDDEGTYGWGGIWTARDGKLMVSYLGSDYQIALKKVED